MTDQSEETGRQTGTVEIRDRMLPGWAGLITWVFIGLSSLGWIAVAVVAFFLSETVVSGQDSFMAPILFGLGCVAVIGALALEWGYSRALAGYRVLRKPVEAQVRAIIAGIIFAVLSIVHPLLGAGIIIGTAANFGFARLYRNALKNDPLWDFDTSEAAAFLAGRDGTGFRLATTRPPGGPSVIRAYRNAATAIATVAVLSSGSWLISEQVLQGTALVSGLLLTLWAVEAIGAWLVLRETENPLTDWQATAVTVLEKSVEDAEDAHKGLWVGNLNVSNAQGGTLLHDISFDVEPGMMIGVLGGVAAGKSLLLHAISDPYSITGLDVRGTVRFAQDNLWQRLGNAQVLPAAYLPRDPLVLAADGMANLACHGDPHLQDRGRKILEQMLFSSELAEQILDAPDARNLSAGQKKALGLARLFLLNPGLYLMDRPEDGATDALIAALCQRIQIERRAGRSFVVVTGNRALLEMCDALIVMEDGRIIDKGPADDVTERMTAGWSRLVVDRTLEAEDALQSWVRSHFRRDGDEANRRSVSIVAGELLALSVQDQSGTDTEQMSFDFKHHQGYCTLRLRDSSPLIGSTQIMKAEREKVTEIGKTPPTALARVFRATTFFEQEEKDGDRLITVKIKTFDPRLKKRGGVESAKDGR
ncbi:MAG: ATP-binding cassette domain-containing protein [Brevirhabdus sp.]